MSNPEFRYNPESHVYTLDGVELPSVTRLLSPLHDFSGIPEHILKHAAERGQAVHKAIELDCANDLDERSVHPEIKPYLKAWRRFFVEWEPEIIASEQQVYHPIYRYAGTLDTKLVARGVPYYVDFKATAEIPPTVGIQLCAYKHADVAMPHDDPLNFMWATARQAVLWLGKNGQYKFLEQTEEDWDLFVELAMHYHAKQKMQFRINQWKKLHLK